MMKHHKRDLKRFCGSSELKLALFQIQKQHKDMQSIITDIFQMWWLLSLENNQCKVHSLNNWVNHVAGHIDSGLEDSEMKCCQLIKRLREFQEHFD